MSRRFGFRALAVLGLGLMIGLLGLDLPASARDERLSIQRRGFGEYRAYIRFTVNPGDVPSLLADPAFQPQQQAGDLLVVFRNAAIGDRPLAAEVLQARPSWWRPQDGSRFTLVYRSPSGPDPGYPGPDAAWYIVDTSDAAQAVVHVYVLEVSSAPEKVS